MTQNYPLNKILSNQYTSGGEYVYKLNQNNFKGYYYVIGESKFYSGSLPSDSIVEIIPYSSQNQTFSVTSQISSPTQTRYITRVLNVIPITYKFIDETTFERLQSITGYQVIAIPPGFDISSLDSNKYPGLQEFLNNN
jgi:hypothetical protein